MDIIAFKLDITSFFLHSLMGNVLYIISKPVNCVGFREPERGGGGGERPGGVAGRGPPITTYGSILRLRG